MTFNHYHLTIMQGKRMRILQNEANDSMFFFQLKKTDPFFWHRKIKKKERFQMVMMSKKRSLKILFNYYSQILLVEIFFSLHSFSSI